MLLPSRLLILALFRPLVHGPRDLLDIGFRRQRLGLAVVAKILDPELARDGRDLLKNLGHLRLGKQIDLQVDAGCSG